MGPQQKEFHREILRTEQVGVRGPNKKNFTEKFYGQGKFGRTRWDTVFKTNSVSHFFCFITCKVKLMLSQIQVLKDYELLVVYVTKITTTLMLLLQILQSI